MTSQATGKSRLRVQPRLFRKPILVHQSEWQVTGRVLDEHGCGPDYDYTEWRDTTVEDITEKNNHAPNN